MVTIPDYAPLTLADYVEQMRTIPGGDFYMGSDDGDKYERPSHLVNVSTYKIGSTPVTVGMWKEYVIATASAMPSNPPWGWIDDHPMVRISWNDVMGAGGFCDWATQMTGQTLKLPSEAQWEYCARDGKGNIKYPWGNEFDYGKLWCSTRIGENKNTVPVDRDFRVFINSFGVSDLAGNVSEWCLDWHAKYTSDYTKNPTGPASARNKCLRQGSWSDIWLPSSFRCASRDGVNPGWNVSHIGFRIAMTI